MSCPLCGAESFQPKPEMLARLKELRARIVELGLRRADDNRGLLCSVCLWERLCRFVDEPDAPINASGGVA